MPAAVLPPVRSIFRALATTIVPEAERLDETAWRDVERIVEEALASRPRVLRRQLGMLIRALQVMPIARWGRPFTALDPARRTRLLLSLQDGPVFLLRRGIWGLRTLVVMGYYARPEVRAELGYRAHPRGWLARHQEPVVRPESAG